MIKSLGILSIWLLGSLFLFIGININEPYLISLRGFGAVAISIASVVLFVRLIKLGYWSGRGVASKLLIVQWCLPSLSILCAQALFEIRKRNVLQTEIARAHTLGQHFIVGYSSFKEIALAGSKAQLMIGHVSPTAVDPDRPASRSKRIVNGIIRQKWNYHGVIITDDLVMGAIYGHKCLLGGGRVAQRERGSAARHL